MIDTFFYNSVFDRNNRFASRTNNSTAIDYVNQYLVITYYYAGADVRNVFINGEHAPG